MSVAANIAARKFAETVVDLINGELRGLIDQHGQEAIAPFFSTLRECYGDNLTVEVERDPAELKPMSDAQAVAFGQRRMPWGKHKDKTVDQTPLDYLEWVASRPDEFKDDLNRYLMSGRVREERERDDERFATAEEQEGMPF